MAIKTLREQRNEAAAGLNYYAALSGKGPTFAIEPAPARKPKAATDVPSEWSEQVAFVQWFRAQFPGVVIFAIPNGGARDAVTAGRMKREGVLPGVPDLYVPAWHLWVEMKRRTGGRQSPEQKEIETYLLGCGDTYLLCRGCDDAIAQVRLFVKYREMPKVGQYSIDKSLLRRLIALCHPDKHRGSELATLVTQQLLGIRDGGIDGNAKP